MRRTPMDELTRRANPALAAAGAGDLGRAEDNVQPQRNRPKKIPPDIERSFMLYLITWLTDFAGFLMLFSVERQLAELGFDAAWMGAIGALFSAAGALSTALSGRYSDQVGRRRVALDSA